jgi:transcription-repair coupling factor (superfamily II helicase)
MSLESDRPLYELIQARRQTPKDILLVHVAQDEARMDYCGQVLSFFDPDIQLLRLPPWNTDPYARISPDREIMAERLATLSRLHTDFGDRLTLLVIAAPALLQKVAPPSFFKGQVHQIRVGDNRPDARVEAWLRHGGYARVSTVRQRGDVCQRGGIIDVFPPFSQHPVRMDRFGDTVESLRAFDPLSQCTIRSVKSVTLSPVCEVILTEASIQQFKEAYRVLSAGHYTHDPFYQAIESGQAFPGMEHWLPLFHGPLVSIQESLPKNAILTQDPGYDLSLSTRWSMIQHLYEERTRTSRASEIPYYPVSVESLFVPPMGF